MACFVQILCRLGFRIVFSKATLFSVLPGVRHSEREENFPVLKQVAFLNVQNLAQPVSRMNPSSLSSTI